MSELARKCKGLLFFKHKCTLCYLLLLKWSIFAVSFQEESIFSSKKFFLTFTPTYIENFRDKIVWPISTCSRDSKMALSNF